MKKSILSIIIILGVQAQVLSQAITCPAPSDSLHLVFPLAESFTYPIPDFGFNGKIDYPDTADVLKGLLNFRDPDFRNTIASLGLDRLRFPGGTVSNGYYSITTEYVTDATGNIEDIIYYLNNPYLNDSTIDDSSLAYFLFEEGSTLKLGPMLEKESFTFNEMNSTQTLLRKSCSMSAEGNDSAYTEKQVWNEKLQNYLRDYLSLCDSAGIAPLHVLRVFDPLLYKAMDDSLGEVGLSPILLDRLGLPNDQDSMACADFPQLRDSLLKASENEIKRQLIKIGYEYAKLGGDVTLADSLLFQLYLNGAEQNTGQYSWSEFNSFWDINYSTVSLTQVYFELGNELYSIFMRKFIPADCQSTEPDVNLYGEISAQAMLRIREVFPLAHIGVVGGKRRQRCEWIDSLKSVFDEQSVSTLYDAWIIHNYSDYEEVFDQSNLLSEENETFLNSPVAELMSATANDHDIDYDNKKIWYTEFNVNLDETNTHFGSWMDLMGKWALINQYLARSPAFQADILSSNITGVADLYNADVLETFPPMDIEMMLMQTLRGGKPQTGIFLYYDSISSSYSYDYADQGLIAAIMDKMTENGHELLRPLSFVKDAGAPLIETDQRISYTSPVICPQSASFTSYSPLLWAWKFETPPSENCPEQRYLLVNSSRECVHVEGLPDYLKGNVDILSYRDTIQRPMLVTEDELDFILNPMEGSFKVGPEGYYFWNGAMHPSLESETGFLLPPYTIMLFKGLASQDLSSTGISTSSCPMGATGTLSLEATGGLAPYSYHLAGQEVGAFVNDLAAGQYDLTITDSLGCSITQTYTIPEESVDYPDGLIAFDGPSLSGSWSLNGNLVIPDGVNYVIDNAELRFGPDAGIIVEAGGHLEISGASLLTSLSCSNVGWAGIYAAGSIESDRVLIHGETRIENARSALNNYLLTPEGEIDSATLGGRYDVRDARFKNNRKDIDFKEFQYWTGAGILLAQNTTLRACSFITDDAYALEALEPSVYLYNVAGMGFYECLWEDQRSLMEMPLKRIGIEAFNSSFFVRSGCVPDAFQPCAYSPSRFMDLSYGIRASGNTLHQSFLIDNNEFHCYKGMLLENIALAQVIRNDFNCPLYEAAMDDSERPYGLMMNSCTGYDIEANHFMAAEIGTSPFGNPVGAQIENGHGDGEEFYRNSFDGFEASTSAVGQNRNEINQNVGLQVRCNEYGGLEDNQTDIYVKADGPFSGIARHQGDGTNPGANGENLAGNIFSQGPEVVFNYINPTEDDDPLFNVNPIFYFHHQSDGMDGIVPTYESGYSGIQPEENPDLEITNLSCPNNISKPYLFWAGLTKSLELQDEIAQVQSYLETVVDDGDTESMQSEVMYTTDQDAWEKYLYLMSEAGYLSEEVLKEIAGKEEGFTDLMIRDILYANPQAAKSEEVKKELDERANPLPQWMIEQIESGKTKLSAKEYLEMQRDGLRHERDQLIQHTLRKLLQDESENHSTEVMLLLTNTGDIGYDYVLLDYYDAVGESDLAEQLVAVMLGYVLDAQKAAELSNYLSLRQTIQDWEANGVELDKLNAQQLEIAQNLAEASARNARLANPILTLNGVKNKEAAYVPSEADKRSSQFGKPGTQSASQLEIEVFPNPAAEYIVLEIRSDEILQSSETKYNIHDIKGVTFLTGVIQSELRQQFIDISLLTEGSYTLSVVDALGGKAAVKFNVIR